MQSVDDKVWKIAQIAFLARQATTLLEELPKGVHEIDNDELDESVAVDRDALRELADVLLDVASQIETAVSTLPTCDFTINRSQLLVAADRALRRGIPVAEQVLFASPLLPYPDAFRALADGLMSTDARRTWADLTIAHLLGHPTASTVEQGAVTAASAGLNPAAEVSTCSDKDVRQLALALTVPGRRAGPMRVQGPHATARGD